VEEAVNIPNNGLIANLPNWIVVKVPTTVDKDGVHGVPLGALPHGFAGLLMNQAAVHDLTAKAAFASRRRLPIRPCWWTRSSANTWAWRKCWIR
jgi:alpha-galactosidase